MLGQPECAPVRRLVGCAEANADWLRVYRLRAYASELKTAEGGWSLMHCAMADFVSPA
ncbi:hypothetical protein [Nonomuraea harbinensis]|uniref:SnoaL-like domain-containing protein n=1 Tax=Nonomuraea harbinensis TaxID=1286938 RepID=A0ABW1BVW5_9ACTN|nr:hypothetical protein [Nonomuraea harbinensis]